MLAAFTLDADGLEHAAFSARECIGSADIEIGLKTEEYALRIDSYVPYTENLVIIKLACEAGNANVRAGLFVPDFEPARIERASTETTARITKIFDGPDFDFPTHADACLSRTDGGKLFFNIGQGEEVTFAISVCTNHDGNQLKQGGEIQLEALRRSHLAFWKKFWNQSEISIPSEPNIERYWYGSQYIMACSSKKGCFAPGIFGPFITTDYANWASDYHLNYNYQAPWWGVFSSNHVELSEPYDQPLMEYIPRAQQNARELLGCRGIYSVVGIGPKGYESSAMFRKDNGERIPEAPFLGQKSNAVYASVNMLMRFYATYDEEYVRRCAYPYCREVADFWEDYLRWDGRRYVIENDCIHENGYAMRDVSGRGNDLYDYSGDFNSIVSLALVRMLMRGMLEMSEFLGVDENRREKWRHILEHLSDYATQERNGRKVFRYTEKGMAWCDSNSLGIQLVYPARGIGLSSSTELREIALNTLNELNRWEDYNAFPTFFTAACYLGYDPDELLRRLNRELRVHGFDNLFVYYGGGGLECASAVPSTINNMFLQSHEEYLRIFPVWNRRTEAAFRNLRAEGAFIVSGSVKDGNVAAITLQSEKGRVARVLSPWERGMHVYCDGTEVACDVQTVAAGMVYAFETEATKVYEMVEA